MLFRLFKVLPLVLFTFLATNIYSFGTTTNTKCRPSQDYTESYKQGHPTNEQQMTSGYNAPSRIDVEGSWDFFLTGSFIYWQPRQGGLDLGRCYHSDPATNGPGKILNVDFDYKPGFKVSLGWNTNFDHWTFFAEYTWLKGKIKTRYNIPSGPGIVGIYVPWYDDTLYFYDIARVTSDWRPSLNLVDGIYTRAYYNGTNLTFKPFGGVRAYWLDQKYTTRLINIADEFYKTWAKSDSWAVGLRAGFYGNWFLGEGFRFIGNASGSLAYQHFKVAHKSWDRTEVLHRYYKNMIGHITPNIEGEAGLGWGTYLSNNEWHLDLSATYRFLYFWNQNVMRDLVNKINQGINSMGDLYFHGLTITLKLDF